MHDTMIELFEKYLSGSFDGSDFQPLVATMREIRVENQSADCDIAVDIERRVLVECRRVARFERDGVCLIDFYINRL